MTQSGSPNHCLDIPIDHRLRSLLQPYQRDSHPCAAKHAKILEKYGKALLNSRKDISGAEIQFNKTLAMPETKGGVLILLQQPASNQLYDGLDFDTIVQQCETLRAVDNVLRTVVGSSLKETSCFDAFPFQKVPISKKSMTGNSTYEVAYQIFEKMIHEKQPDVVLCCYQSPDPAKFNMPQSLGVGKTLSSKERFGDRICIPVNAFHPSYAINYNRSESCFRTLYILQALLAYHVCNGTEKEREWMRPLRLLCQAKAAVLSKGTSAAIRVGSKYLPSL
jgi:hypothetical protein